MPVRVLIVDDTEDDAILIGDILALDMSLVWTRAWDETSFRACLKVGGFDAVVCDYSLPDFSPLLAMEILRALGLDLPFIVVSGTLSEEAAVTVLKAGAHDFCTKENLTRLTPAVLREIEQARRRAEARKLEAALGESEERFRILANHAPVLIWMSGTDGLCDWFNRPWIEFRGRTLEQELAEGWAEGVHPEDLAKSMHVYKSHFEARKKFHMEYRLQGADGRYRWFLDTGSPRVDASGAFAGFIGTCIDITEMKAAQGQLRLSHDNLERIVDKRTRALSESEERFRTLVASLEDAVLTIDADGLVTGAYGKGLAKLGLPAEDLAARKVAQLLGERLVEYAPAFRDAFQGKPAAFETASPFGDGHILLNAMSPFRDDSGKIVGIVWILRDVSELRKIHREMLDIVEWQRKGLGTAVHEGLGQRLAGAAFFGKSLERVLKQKGDQTAQEAATLTALLEEAIQESRELAQGLFPIELEAHGLRMALESLAGRMRKSLEIDCEVHGDLNLLELDKEQAYHLYRIAEEAVMNASQGGEARTIALFMESFGDDGLALRVADDGIGIDDDDLRNPGLGIKLMQYRANFIGASLLFRRRSKRGTEVVCRLVEIHSQQPY